MITRAMIKVAKVEDGGLPFPNLDRYRAGVVMFAEQMIDKGHDPVVVEIAKSRLALQVWNTLYQDVWLKVRAMNVMVRQRRWAELEIALDELNTQFTDSIGTKE